MIEPNSAWIEADIITSAGDFEVSVLKIDFACDANILKETMGNKALFCCPYFAMFCFTLQEFKCSSEACYCSAIGQRTF